MRLSLVEKVANFKKGKIAKLRAEAKALKPGTSCESLPAW